MSNGENHRLFISFRSQVIEKIATRRDSYHSVPTIGLLSISEIKVFDLKVGLRSTVARRDIVKRRVLQK